MDELVIFGAKYLFVVVILGAVIPFIQPRKDVRTRYLFAAVVTGVLAFASTKLAGAMYFDPRPFTHGVKALISHDAENGFPSDHTVLSFAAALLTYRYSRPMCACLALLAAVVGTCRVLAGVHSPVDVVAGAALGISAALLGTWLSGFVVRKGETAEA